MLLACAVLRWDLKVTAVDDVQAKIDKLKYAQAHMLVRQSGSTAHYPLVWVRPQAVPPTGVGKAPGSTTHWCG